MEIHSSFLQLLYAYGLRNGWIDFNWRPSGMCMCLPIEGYNFYLCLRDSRA